MLELKDILFTLELSIVALVFSNILIEVGGLFEKYGDLLANLYNKGGFYKYISRPLGYCAKCFSGQISFYVYIITHYYKYNLIENIIFVSITIFFTTLLNKFTSEWIR